MTGFFLTLEEISKSGRQHTFLRTPPPPPHSPKGPSELYSLGFHAPAQSLPGGYHVMLANCPCGTQEKKGFWKRASGCWHSLKKSLIWVSLADWGASGFFVFSSSLAHSPTLFYMCEEASVDCMHPTTWEKKMRHETKAGHRTCRHPHFSNILQIFLGRTWTRSDEKPDELPQMQTCFVDSQWGKAKNERKQH